MKINFFSCIVKVVGVVFIIFFLVVCVGGGMVMLGGQNVGVSGVVVGGFSVGVDLMFECCVLLLGIIVMDDGCNVDWYGQFGSVIKVMIIDLLLCMVVQ